MKSESTPTASAIGASTADWGTHFELGSTSADRADELLRQRREEVYRESDQPFVRLLLLEWVVLVILALIVAPDSWSAPGSRIGLPVWAAIIFGGAVTLPPVALARIRPGAAITRYTVAVAQMLLSGLLINLSGDRPETHFHVFCSLVILSFYRDWRVMVLATLVATADHFLHDVYWPFSMHEVFSASPWRSIEHCAWIVFSGILLGISCLRSNREVRGTAIRTIALQEQTGRLAASQHANRLIMDKSRDAICANDAEGRFLTVSAACEALWGYTPEELIGKSCGELVHPEDREKSRLANLEIMAGHSVTDFENRYVRKDGTIVNVLWSAYWSESDGTMFQVARDVTQRKQAEAALQKTNRQLSSALQANQLIMDNSQDVICALDAKGQFLSTNAACQVLWGYQPEELIGRCYLALVRPEDRALTKQAEDATRLGSRISDFVNRCVRKDGSTVDVLWSASWSEADEILFCVAHDATESQRNEKVLREAKEAADRANRAKSEFLSRMSHELRTPLNAILGFGQLLERQNPVPAQRPHLQHILTAGRHLLELINEVLDISRIESEKMHLSLEPVSVRVALEEAVDLIQPLATERSVNLLTPSEDEMDFFVLADHQRLKQVLLNLLNNGVKYTPPSGSVIVTCKDAGGRVRLAVHDTGVGIAADKLERVFTPFDRLGAEQSGIEGTGLGLALSKRLVQAMRGAIGVESMEGQGSTFWLELVRTKSPLDAIPAKSSVVARSKRVKAAPRRSVLYIEDNLSNLTLIEELLHEDAGFHLLTAMQGRIGLDLARQHSPDLILLDLHLPDMPGWDVLAELQGSEATRRIPTIVVSADATEGQFQRLLDAGARDYITKPIDVTQFYHVMEMAASNKEECLGV
jgi:PAS domain S-box-containing protein